MVQEAALIDLHDQITGFGLQGGRERANPAQCRLAAQVRGRQVDREMKVRMTREEIRRIPPNQAQHTGGEALCSGREATATDG